MEKQLVQSNISQVISMAYPSALADDNELRLVFTLEVRNGTAIGLWGGGVYQGRNYVGAFSGLIGFNHDVIGERREAAEALLGELQDILEEDYGVPKPVQLPEGEESPEEDPESPAEEGGE
jgi:hypothetical protein